MSFSVQLTSLSMIISRSIHIVANGLFCSFLWLSSIPPIYIYLLMHSTSLSTSLSFHLLMDIWVAPMSWLQHLFVKSRVSWPCSLIPCLHSHPGPEIPRNPCLAVEMSLGISSHHHERHHFVRLNRLRFVPSSNMKILCSWTEMTLLNTRHFN